MINLGLFTPTFGQLPRQFADSLPVTKRLDALRLVHFHSIDTSNVFRNSNINLVCRAAHRLQKTQFRRCKSYQSFFHSKKTFFGATGTILGLGGFSVGFMGFFEKKKELTIEEQVLMEIKRSILAIQEGNLAKAEEHLSKSWQLSDLENLEQAKTQILDIQANLSFQKEELEKAENLFKRVTQRLIYHQNVAANDNSIIEISIKLALIYAKQGKHEESIAGFEYCANAQREKIEKHGADDEDTLLLAAWAIQSLSQMYLSFGSSDKIEREVVRKAQSCAKEAYKYASMAVGADSQQAVAIASDLATILALEGDIDGAIEKLQECNVIAGEKHKFLQAAIRVNTGSLYMQKGEYDEAERICKEARMIARRVKDAESAARAESCISRSSTLRNASAQRLKAKSKESVQ